MEGKRNRLKRKPKVSPVVSADSQPPAVKTQPDGQAEGGDVIIIDEESPTSVSTKEPKVEVNNDIQPEGAAKNKDKALEALIKALLAVNRHRKQQPVQSLPDLPAYQENMVSGKKPALFPHPNPQDRF